MQANKPNLQFDGSNSTDGYYQRLSYYAADINKDQLNGFNSSHILSISRK